MAEVGEKRALGCSATWGYEIESAAQKVATRGRGNGEYRGRMRSRASSAERGIQLCLGGICDSARWPVGHAHFIAQEDAIGFRIPTGIWHIAAGVHYQSLHAAIHTNRLRPQEDWHSRIVATAKPVAVYDLAREPPFAGKQVANDFGLRSSLGMPVQVGKQGM
jgi:hypothetical protein